MLILGYTSYEYYEPQVELEWADGQTLDYYERAYFKGKNEGYSDFGDGNSQYFKITNKNQLIKALRYLLKEDFLMQDQCQVQTEDLIKLLRDGNLGDTFFQRFLQNTKWLQDRRDLRQKITKYDGDYDYGNQLLILDGKTPVYLVKENLELQKAILSFCLEKNLKFKNEWFDIKEQDIQQWRHETEIKKLKDTLIKKQQDLTATQNKIKRLEKEIIDLQEKIRQTEGA